jgi:hypothetical protein
MDQLFVVSIAIFVDDLKSVTNIFYHLRIFLEISAPTAAMIKIGP